MILGLIAISPRSLSSYIRSADTLWALIWQLTREAPLWPALTAMLLVGLPLVCAILRRRRTARGRFVEPRSPWRLGFATICLFSTLAAGWLAGLTAYTWRAYHDLQLRPRPGLLTTWAFHRGTVGWIRQTDDMPETEPRISPGPPVVWSCQAWMGWTGEMTDKGFLGIHYDRSRSGGHYRPGETTSLRMPVAYPIGVLLVLPLIWTARQIRFSRRRRRADAGQCIHCGYDLRQSPQRCPECGRPAQRWPEPMRS